MRNSIKNHNIKNKADLNQRQETVQNEYEDLKRNIVDSILNPIEIGSLIYSFVSKKKRKQQEKRQVWHPENKIINGNASSKKPQSTSFLKSVGKSFLRWQLFNLGYFVGKKIIQQVKASKK